MPFEYPDLVGRKWEATPQYRLHLLLREGFHYSLGNVGRKLPEILWAMKGVGDPELAGYIKAFTQLQAQTDALLAKMRPLIQYAEDQFREVRPAGATKRYEHLSNTELAECVVCQAIFEGYATSKYCCEECRDKAHEEKAKQQKAKGKKK